MKGVSGTVTILWTPRVQSSTWGKAGSPSFLPHLDPKVQFPNVAAGLDRQSQALPGLHKGALGLICSSGWFPSPGRDSRSRAPGVANTTTTIKGAKPEDTVLPPDSPFNTGGQQQRSGCRRVNSPPLLRVINPGELCFGDRWPGRGPCG